MELAHAVEIPHAKRHEAISQQKPDQPGFVRAGGQQQVEQQRHGQSMTRDREMALPREETDAGKVEHGDCAPPPQGIPPLAMQRDEYALRDHRNEGEQRVQIIALVELEQPAMPSDWPMDRGDAELSELLHHTAK